MYMKLNSLALLLLVSTVFAQTDNQLVNTSTPTPTVEAQYSIVTIAPSSLPSCTVHPHCPTIPIRCPDDCPKLCYVTATDACCPYVGQLTCTSPEGNTTATATTIVSTGNATTSLNGTISAATSASISGNPTNATGSPNGNGTGATPATSAGGSLKATKVSNGWIVAAAGLVAAFAELAL